MYTLYHHSITEISMNGYWYKYDTTLDIHVTNRSNLYPVEFISDKDFLMNTRTQSVSRHIKYVKDYGLYANITFDEVIS